MPAPPKAAPFFLGTAVLSCFLVVAIPALSPRPEPNAVINPGPIIFLIFVAVGGILSLPALFFALYSLFRLPRSGVLWLILVAGCVFPAAASYEIYYPRYQREFDRTADGRAAAAYRKSQEVLVEQWQALGAYVNPYLRAYYRKHPERFLSSGDDSVVVDGFAEFLLSQSDFASNRVTIVDGQIIDPWGAPVIFVLNRDSKDVLFARYCYLKTRRFGGIVRVALLTDPNHVTSTNKQEHWAIRGSVE
jgi:hypothetical protein